MPEGCLGGVEGQHPQTDENASGLDDIRIESEGGTKKARQTVQLHPLRTNSARSYGIGRTTFATSRRWPPRGGASRAP